LETVEKTIKILFVEDEMNMRFFLKTLLETNGFFPIIAKNGKEGIRLAKEESPDLILLDVMMPEQGGSLMYQNLREEEVFRMIPVIILSGISKRMFYHYLDMVNVQKQEKIPYPEAYIQKPPEPNHLLRMIQKVLKLDKL